jgi:hypothetical protein
MKLVLIRDFNSIECTLGKLHITAPGQDFVCDTIERPWIPMPGAKGGLSGKSCVPKGIYSLERHSSEQHPDTWALVNSDLDVIHYEDRTRPNARCLVLIHPANYARELRGCIAPGLRRTVDADGFHMVTSSRLAMLEVRRFVLPYSDAHTLEIR